MKENRRNNLLYLHVSTITLKIPKIKKNKTEAGKIKFKVVKSEKYELILLFKILQETNIDSNKKLKKIIIPSVNKIKDHNFKVVIFLIRNIGKIKNKLIKMEIINPKKIIKIVIICTNWIDPKFKILSESKREIKKLLFKNEKIKIKLAKTTKILPNFSKKEKK